jgi:hypothetical protein
MATVLSPLHFGAVIALQLVTWQIIVGDISRNLPFLENDDPDTICENAIRYAAPQSSIANSRATYTGNDQSSLPLPRTATSATRLVADSDISSSEMPGASPVTISINSSIYAPRKPLLGKIQNADLFSVFYDTC